MIKIYIEMFFLNIIGFVFMISMTTTSFDIGFPNLPMVS